MTRPWCLIVLLVATASARADDTPTRLPPKLTLGEALALFRAHGLDLLIAEAAIQGAEGDVTTANAIPNPSLSVSYGPYAFYWKCTNAMGCSRPPSSVSAEITDQAAIEDTLSGKRHLRNEIASAALRAAKLGRVDAERTLAYQVKAQFEQVLLAQSAVRFAKDTADANALMLDKAEKQRDADKIQRPDLLRVRVAKLESDQELDQAQQGLRKARAELAFLLGVRDAVPEFVVAEPQLEHYALPNALASANHDALLAQAFAARPDLQAQEAQLASAEAARHLARRQRFPDVTLSLGYTQQGIDQNAASPPTFSIGLSAPIPVLYQQQGEIAKTDAVARQQRLQVEKLRAQIVNDFESAYADFIASQALVRRMEEGALLETARQAKDDVKLLYEKGGAQLVDYLVALSTYISTNLEYLNDVAGYWTAVFELEQAVGKELR
ncbi:MAG TPA: TolC family protein [Kofleriaceae bacterium]|nr:TolC family protein [Kofleriaceae bacterium]